MRKVILTIFLSIFTSAIILTSCREEKTTQEKIEAALKEIDKEAEEAGREVSSEVKEAWKDAKVEIKEVREESMED